MCRQWGKNDDGADTDELTRSHACADTGENFGDGADIDEITRSIVCADTGQQLCDGADYDELTRSYDCFEKIVDDELTQEEEDFEEADEELIRANDMTGADSDEELSFVNNLVVPARPCLVCFVSLNMFGGCVCGIPPLISTNFSRMKFSPAQAACPPDFCQRESKRLHAKLDVIIEHAKPV